MILVLIIRSIISQTKKAFKKSSMQQTKFLDLVIQLNYPYLYKHAGECEHIVYIREIRTRMPDDSSGIKCTFENRPVIPICDVCELNTPVNITWNDLYAPKSPCFWCSVCYKEFHFDQDGNAVYDFDSVSISIKY